MEKIEIRRIICRKYPEPDLSCRQYGTSSCAVCPKNLAGLLAHPNAGDPVLRRKMLKYASRPAIREQRRNFLFLENGTLVYNSAKFDSVADAIVDAVSNHGESLDDLLRLVYHEDGQSLNMLRKKFMDIIEKKQ